MFIVVIFVIFFFCSLLQNTELLKNNRARVGLMVIELGFTPLELAVIVMSAAVVVCSVLEAGS